MRKINLCIIALILISNVNAQIDRSKLPKPAPAKSIQIGDYESFTLENKLKVIVVRSTKLPKISLNLVFANDPIMEKDKAGYLGMVGSMLRKGTTTKTKEQLDEEIDFIGATLEASANSIYASSLTKHQDKLLGLMTDVLFNPIFPAEELEKIKTITISRLAANKENANSISANLTTVLIYGKNHPYGEIPTEQTVENITVDDIEKYYATYFKPNVAYLAIVGDISINEAKKLIKKYFSKWKMGTLPSSSFKTPQYPKKTFVALVDRPSSVQSVIDITYPIDLKTGTPDVIKARVLNQILGGGSSARLFTNLREDKGFTYGAYSSLISDKIIGYFSANASVRNAVTDSAFSEFITELKKIKNTNVSKKELDLAKNVIMGRFARSLERPQTVANFAINLARYKLPKNYYSSYLKNVESVSIAEVRATAQKYIHPDRAYLTVVGKASEIKEKLAPFGEIKYYDNYGNEYTEDITPSMPNGLTAEKVIANYIEAIGGRKSLAAISAIKIESEAEFQGQKINIINIKKAPNSQYELISLGGVIELNKELFDGKNYTIYSQGQEISASATQVDDAIIKSYLFPELKYQSLGVALKLNGIEKIENNYFYSLDIILPSGSITTEYFHIQSGLKFRAVSYRSTPEGEVAQQVDIKDYSEEKGIMFPHTFIIPLEGGVKIEAKVTSVEVNGEINSAIFSKK